MLLAWVCKRASTKYDLNQWSQLTLYLEEPRLPIDNNGVENAICPCKLGQKNHIFFGRLEAGKHNATLYGLIENSKSAGLKLREYLEHYLEYLPNTKASDLTPLNVAEVN